FHRTQFGCQPLTTGTRIRIVDRKSFGDYVFRNVSGNLGRFAQGDGTPDWRPLGGSTMKIMKGRALRATATAAMLAVFGAPVVAEELFYVSGAVGNAVEDFKAIVKPWEEATGHTVTMVPMPASTTDQFGQYRLWLAAGATDIDLYQTDVIWAPQLADHFVDLT